MFHYNTHSEIVPGPSNGTIRGFAQHNDTTFVLGGFFAIHNPSAEGKCDNSLDERGLERVEAFLYSIDSINNDPALLPGITLGYKVRDTCSLENIALDEAISVLFEEDGLAGGNCNDVAQHSNEYSVLGIIGPTSSHVAVPLAGLLRLFRVPQVSYSASSSTLNNRDRYGYFYRTIPPDNLQAQAMVDLLMEFDWNLVSILHSNNNYGEEGSEAFRQIADSVGICIDLDIGLNENFMDEDFTAAASNLYHNSVADVVVFFSSRNFIDPFMAGLVNVSDSDEEDTNPKKQFFWIASESWSQANDIVNMYQDILAGRMLGLAPVANNLPDQFEEYFSNLTLTSNKRNPWFKEYFEFYHNCMDSECPQNSSFNSSTSDYSYTPFNIELVVESVYSLAHALNDYFKDNCLSPYQWNFANYSCVGQRNELNGSSLRQYLQEVDFISPTGKRVYFNQFGNPEATTYEITNYNKSQLNFVRIGTWNESFSEDDRLDLFDDDQLLLTINSSCQACPLGNIREEVPSSCCWGCAPCLGRDYNAILNSKVCNVCESHMWGDNPLKGSSHCRAIEELYLSLSEGFGIFLTVLCSLGLLLVFIVVVGMARLWNNPIIKSSGREQMVLLLFGVAMCFVLTAAFLIRPSYAVCFFQRAGTWFCFSVILSALLIKLVRITRIFLRRNTSKPPRFIQPWHQIVFSLLLVALQMVLVLVSLIVVYPESQSTTLLNKDNTNDHPKLLVTCAPPNNVMFVILLLYYSVLLIVSNALAVITIKFPDNFNEVRYVAFSTFSVGIIWIALCVSYFATRPQHHSALLSFGIQMSAVAVLLCFFLPRMFSALLMQYFTKKELYSFTTGSSNTNRLSMPIITETAVPSHKIVGETYDDDLRTDTFQATPMMIR